MGKKRKYQPKPIDVENEPWYLPGIGQIYKLSGLLFEGGDLAVEFLFPDNSELTEDVINHVITPTLEEWGAILQRSDHPLVNNGKAWVRKSEYVISGFVQQQIWVRDGFKCMYCGVPMGEALMTIDHFVPLELGGKNDPSNYIAACKRCNKEKGSIDPKEWLGDKFESFKLYLESNS